MKPQGRKHVSRIPRALAPIEIVSKTVTITEKTGATREMIISLPRLKCLEVRAEVLA